MSITLSNLTMSRVSAGSSGVIPPSGDPYWSSVSLLTETTSVNGATNESFKDSSSNNYTVTNVGASTDQITQGTFGPVAGGYSGYFTGSTGSRLEFPNFSFCTGDFTIEAWVRPTVTNTNQIIFAQTVGGGTTQTCQLNIEASNKLTYKYFTTSSSTSQVNIQSTIIISPNVWTHVAISRSGTTVKMFVNGVAGYTGTIATMYQGNNIGGVGGYPSNNIQPFFGYISDVRVTTTAVYTSDFSVPTAPLTAITGTKLLLSFANAGIYDAAAKNDIFTRSTAQVSTAQKKFGTSSILLNGTTDYLTIPPTTAFTLGTGDFTIEAWIYLTTAATNGGATTDKWVFGGFNFTPALGMFIYNSTSYKASIWNGTNQFNSSITINPNQWTHVAWVRQAGVLNIYTNGVSGYTNANYTTNWTASTTAYIGRADSSASRYFPGYIQDMRITKGVARYTANFTPPTAAFPTN